MSRRSLVALFTSLSLASLAPGASAGPASQPLDLSLLLDQVCAAPANLVVLSKCMDQPEASYVAESMPKAGILTIAGTKFRWPGSATQTPDSLRAAGQTLTVKTSKGHRSDALLVAGHHGRRSGDVTVTYTDGSKVRRSITAADWFVPAGASAIKGIKVQYIAQATNSAWGFDEGGVFLAVAPVDPKKTVAKVGLPSSASQMIVFAVSLSPLKAAPAGGPVFN